MCPIGLVILRKEVVLLVSNANHVVTVYGNSDVDALQLIL